jgi:hypothetical protein
LIGILLESSDVNISKWVSVTVRTPSGRVAVKSWYLSAITVRPKSFSMHQTSEETQGFGKCGKIALGHKW